LRIIGVDTGGTFTDLIAVDGEEVRAEKLASTPDDPGRAVLEGIARLVGGEPLGEVVHGTTVALNALLTGRYADAALVTNAGFADLIEIGRQERPELYALHPVKPSPLIPRRLRFEVNQRSWPGEDGRLVTEVEPTERELDELRARIRRSGAKSLAICLLHSYADPGIEQRLAEALRPLGLPITCSATVLREYREYERFSSCCANAVLVPVMGDYLERLRPGLPGARLSILQSSGGTMAAERAAREPARALLSGPAGGVVGAARAAPIGFPSLDIHTIGCGGGSIVFLDSGGILHVGPESAGADPGPLCYGRGEELTVTDAHVMLGHVAEGRFVGGRLSLDTERVERAFEELGRRLGASPIAAARAVLEVARAAMRRAIGVMTMQRGHDPKHLPLVAFGGAGGLQAAALAASLDLPGALVPRLPGCLSAHGMACADALSDHSLTVLASLSDWSPTARRRALRGLAEEGRAELLEGGHRAKAIEYEYGLDLRYRGQSFEISVPESFEGGVREEFHRRHEALYGWRLDSREVELVNLRTRAVVRRPLAERKAVRAERLPRGAVVGGRAAWFEGRGHVPVIDRDALGEGVRFEGPALVEEYSGTTLVPPGWSARVTAGGHLWLEGRTG